MSRSILVVVPCGSAKIWDRHPCHGPTPARDAYIGSPFVVNRQYAEHFGSEWRILSAKFGLVASDFLIPEAYNVSFKRRSTGPITPDELRMQVQDQQLDAFETVVGLGGKEYRSMVEQAFALPASRVIFPFAGLPLGLGMAAVKDAIRRNILIPAAHEPV